MRPGPDVRVDVARVTAVHRDALSGETLCELELPHQLRNVPRQSPDREVFVSLSGKMQVPFLLDPNTGVTMFESADIRRYLYDTYALNF